MFINYTPFPGLSFNSINVHRRLTTTTLVRAKFKLRRTRQAGEWELRLDPDQGELFTQYTHYDDDLNQPVRYEADLAPYKANTDILLNGNAYARQGTPNTLWHYGIRVEQDNQIILEKNHDVLGPRNYTAQDLIDTESHHPARRFTHFGAVTRHHKKRLKKAGTYDQEWQDKEHPFLPRDFQESHYQSAPEDQQINGHLNGDEIIRLTNLLPGQEHQFFKLPGFQLYCQYRFEQDEKIFGPMNLDTVLIDIESQDREDWRVTLIWRSRTIAVNAEKTEAILEVPDSYRAGGASKTDKITPSKADSKEIIHG